MFYTLFNFISFWLNHREIYPYVIQYPATYLASFSIHSSTSILCKSDSRSASCCMACTNYIFNNQLHGPITFPYLSQQCRSRSTTPRHPQLALHLFSAYSGAPSLLVLLDPDPHLLEWQYTLLGPPDTCTYRGSIECRPPQAFSLHRNDISEIS